MLLVRFLLFLPPLLLLSRFFVVLNVGVVGVPGMRSFCSDIPFVQYCIFSSVLFDDVVVSVSVDIVVVVVVVVFTICSHFV